MRLRVFPRQNNSDQSLLSRTSEIHEQRDDDADYHEQESYMLAVLRERQGGREINDINQGRIGVTPLSRFGVGV